MVLFKDHQKNYSNISQQETSFDTEEELEKRSKIRFCYFEGFWQAGRKIMKQLTWGFVKRLLGGSLLSSSSTEEEER